MLSSANILSTTATSVSAITATPCCSSIDLISSGLLARTVEVGIAVGFYDDLPINRAEEFFILQTGDPKGEEIGYINPDSNELRKVPLEIRTPNLEDTLYG